MKWFLERISSEHLPIFFGYKDKAVHPKDFQRLLKAGVLIRSQNLEEIDCTLCEDTHSCQVRNDKGKLFSICENGNGRQEISDEEITIFEYSNEVFLKLLTEELSITTSRSSFKEVSAHSSDSLYTLGRFEKQKTDVLYIRNANDSEIALFLNDAKLGRKMILSNTEKPDSEESGDILYCCLSDILSDSEKSIFDKSGIEKVFEDVRRVSFDEYGTLSLDGKRIYSAEQKSPDYYFLLFLFENYGVPQPHSAIHHFVRDKRGHDVADTAQNFCQKMKSKIKKECKKIDSVITIPTRGHYMLADPLEETREKKKK